MNGLSARIAIARSDSFRLDVDLSIEAGSTVALLGPNGAGKSTAVLAVAGLLAIDRGHIELGDVVLDDPAGGVFVPPEDRRIGVVFQEYLLFPHLSVVENIAFGLRSRNAPRKEALAAAREWAGRLGLGDLISQRPGDLSGGQAQRVALARALATEPDLLLLDEPLAALDVTTRVELRRSLTDHLEGFAGPRLLITHDPTEAFLLADEIHVIEDGTITQAGSADDIRLRPRTPYAADLAGSNLLTGMAADGVVDVGGYQVKIADHEVSGPVLLIIDPKAVSIHPSPPGGSPRNSWSTEVTGVETLGDRARVRTGSPVPLTIEVTRQSAASLGLEEGVEIWVAIKATEIVVESEDPGAAATLPA